MDDFGVMTRLPDGSCTCIKCKESENIIIIKYKDRSKILCLNCILNLTSILFPSKDYYHEFAIKWSLGDKGQLKCPSCSSSILDDDEKCEYKVIADDGHEDVTPTVFKHCYICGFSFYHYRKQEDEDNVT